MYHVPVMLNECMEGLNIRPDGVYIDVTFGGGGHSRAILDRLGPDGHLYAFDQDADAAANAFDDPRFTFIPHNFRFMKNFIQLYCGKRVDGILADLGVSSHQFDTPEKGFSTRFDGALDMRMNKNDATSAADMVNTYDEASLTRVLSEYGELKNARVFARDIISERENKQITTTFELKSAVAAHLPKGTENKTLAQIFQALRIEVNKEIESLEAFLQQCPDILSGGGRLVVMSYHSLEDRLVKNYMKSGKADGIVEQDFFGNKLTPYTMITHKPVVPDEEETAVNSRARSAKLRVAERRPI